METLKALLEANGITVIDRAGAILMDADNLERALLLLTRLGTFPLGLEGFHLSDGELVPVMDMVVDTSGARSIAEAVSCIQHAVASQGHEALLYELILA